MTSCPFPVHQAPSKKESTLKKEEFAFGFVYVEVLQPSQPNGVMSSMVSLPNHPFTGQT